MSDYQLYISALVLLIPVFTGGACMTLTGFSCRDCLSRQERSLKRGVMLYLLMSFLAWLTILFYLLAPEVFVVLNIPALAGFVLAPVFFYRIIRFLTRTEQTKPLSLWHFIIPALIGAVFLVWSLLVPFEAQVELVRSRQLSMAGEYEAYSRLFTSKPVLRMIFMIVYYSFTFRILVRYYRRASDSDSPVRKPAKWILFLVALSLLFVVSSVTVTFNPRNKALSSMVTAVAAICVSGQHLLLTFHIIRRKYLLYAVYAEPAEENNAAGEKEEIQPGDKSHDKRKPEFGKLTRRRMDAYFRRRKPYLNADFKITDLCEAMETNRGTLSGFINKSYGMNFNRFVNQWRLKEIERLQKLPSNREKSVAKLVAKAGFSEYRQYVRAVAAENGGENNEGNEE